MSDASVVPPVDALNFSPGEQIHMIRRRERVSAGTIAEACGVHRNTVARWEDPTHPSEPSVSQAKVIAKVLGCRIEDIAGGEFLLRRKEQRTLTLHPGGRSTHATAPQRPFAPFRALRPVDNKGPTAHTSLT